MNSDCIKELHLYKGALFFRSLALLENVKISKVGEDLRGYWIRNMCKFSSVYFRKLQRAELAILAPSNVKLNFTYVYDYINFSFVYQRPHYHLTQDRLIPNSLTELTNGLINLLSKWQIPNNIVRTSTSELEILY